MWVALVEERRTIPQPQRRPGTQRLFFKRRLGAVPFKRSLAPRGPYPEVRRVTGGLPSFSRGVPGASKGIRAQCSPCSCHPAMSGMPAAGRPREDGHKQLRPPRRGRSDENGTGKKGEERHWSPTCLILTITTL